MEAIGIFADMISIWFHWIASLSDVACFLTRERKKERGRGEKNVLCKDVQVTVLSIGCSKTGFSRVILVLFQLQAVCNNLVCSNVYEKLRYIDYLLFRHGFFTDNFFVHDSWNFIIIILSRYYYNALFVITSIKKWYFYLKKNNYIT